MNIGLGQFGAVSWNQSGWECFRWTSKQIMEPKIVSGIDIGWTVAWWTPLAGRLEQEVVVGSTPWHGPWHSPQSSCHDSHCSDQLRLHTLKGRLHMDAMDNIFFTSSRFGVIIWGTFIKNIFPSDRIYFHFYLRPSLTNPGTFPSPLDLSVAQSSLRHYHYFVWMQLSRRAGAVQYWGGSCVLYLLNWLILMNILYRIQVYPSHAHIR